MLLMGKLIMKWQQKAKIMKILSNMPMGGYYINFAKEIWTFNFRPNA